MNIIWRCMAICVVLLPAGLAGQTGESLVTAELLADAATIRPGQTFRIGVLLKIKSGWHIYWTNPGDAGVPTVVKLTAPPGFVVGGWQYPVPVRFEQPGEITGYGYTDTVLLIAEAKAPPDLRTGSSVVFHARGSWLACEDVCMPGKSDVKLVLATADASKPAHADLFETWQERMPAAHDSPGRPIVGTHVDGTLSAGSEGAGFALTIDWKAPPRDVEWFPQTPAALAVEDVSVQTEARQTRVAFRARVLPGQRLEGGVLPTVLAWRDDRGRRLGISLPVHLRAAASQP